MAALRTTSQTIALLTSVLAARPGRPRIPGGSAAARRDGIRGHRGGRLPLVTNVLCEGDDARPNVRYSR